MGGLIWLASYPKSGNTWTRAFLHNFIRQGEDTHDINDMRALTSTDNAPGWFKDFIDKPQEQWTPEDVAKARPQAHQLIHDSTEGFVFLKTHNALMGYAGVPMITMRLTAGAIYIVRNPLDMNKLESGALAELQPRGCTSSCASPSSSPRTTRSARSRGWWRTCRRTSTT